MVTSDLAVYLARLIVTLAAGLTAVFLVNRSGRRRRTRWIITAGIALALIPLVLQLVQVVSPWHLPASLILFLTQFDVPGLGFILVGVVLGLRDICRARDQLQQQNLALQKEASTDFLTGLLNRRQADLLLGYGAARARRNGDRLGFIMMDLDCFKHVNDTHGHQVGDAVLAHVGALLKSRLRASDIVARYGGEEFLVVLIGKSHEHVMTLAEELRMLVEVTPVQHGGREIPITISVGVAFNPIDSDDAVKDSIGRADAALYTAKALGRNQVVSWDQVSERVTCRSEA